MLGHVVGIGELPGGPLALIEPGQKIEAGMPQRPGPGAARVRLIGAGDLHRLIETGQRRGEVLSRTVLAEQVWDINFDSDTNVIEVAVRRLRSKLDEPFDSKLLHTVRGMGYVLEERAA